MDQTAILNDVRNRLRHLTREQKTTRVGNSMLTIAELLPLLSDGTSADLVIEDPFDGEKLYHLGRLVVILDILTAQERRPTLVRWFD